MDHCWSKMSWLKKSRELLVKQLCLQQSATDSRSHPPELLATYKRSSAVMVKTWDELLRSWEGLVLMSEWMMKKRKKFTVGSPCIPSNIIGFCSFKCYKIVAIMREVQWIMDCILSYEDCHIGDLILAPSHHFSLKKREPYIYIVGELPQNIENTYLHGKVH